MPEEIEINPREDQERLEELEKEHEEYEREKQQVSWTRHVSLSTAILAVIAAIAALQAGSLVNEALLAKSHAVELQARASDTWAEYQADSIKGKTAEQTATLLAALPGSQAEQVEKFRKDGEKYASTKEEIKPEAQKLEKERDETNHETEHFMHQHHTFAYCVTLTQIAIALSAIAALTRMKSLWYASMGIGLIGLVLLAMGFAGR